MAFLTNLVPDVPLDVCGCDDCRSRQAAGESTTVGGTWLVAWAVDSVGVVTPKAANTDGEVLVVDSAGVATPTLSAYWGPTV